MFDACSCKRVQKVYLLENFLATFYLAVTGMLLFFLVAVSMGVRTLVGRAIPGTRVVVSRMYTIFQSNEVYSLSLSMIFVTLVERNTICRSQNAIPQSVAFESSHRWKR